jgi:hypothetical protein
MKIRKFGQILESNNLDKESILALIQDLSDTHDLEYTLVEGYFSRPSKSSYGGDPVIKNPNSKNDQKCYKLIVDLKKNGCEPSGKYIHGVVVYNSNDLLKILNALSGITRVTETHMYIKDEKLNFIIISDEGLDIDKIEQLYLELVDRKDQSNTGFATYAKIQKTKKSVEIKINGASYSERKLKNFLNGIDLKDFEIKTKSIWQPRGHVGRMITITFELK